ncbi:MAG TPA: DUF5658 family protein [Dehalococcoidales bacterium]|nr:DUF5658 family protein [Dehalococcoidales bacterium]
MYNKIAGILFIVLNILDAYLTKINLARGVEANPLMANIGDDMLFKGLISLAVVIVFFALRWEKWCPLLAMGMFAVVVWNSFMLWL